MKTVKYLFVGALLLCGSVTVMAQTGTSADIEAMKALVKNKPADYGKQVKNYIKANKNIKLIEKYHTTDASMYDSNVRNFKKTLVTPGAPGT